VLTGFAPIPPLERFIDSLSSIQLSPDCLMMEDAALAAQFQRAKGEQFRNVAVLNLGHRKSGMYFLRENMPVLHRNTMVGGYDVTTAISQRYSIGLAEAELAKIDRGFLAVAGMQLNPDQHTFSETIRTALEPVFSDFQQSLMAFTSRYNEPLDVVYVCGGTSLLPGLPEHLAQRWQKKVLPLQVTRLFPQSTIQPQRGIEWLLPVASALGVSQVSGESRSQINFRSGKLYAASRSLNLNLGQFVYPAKLALTVYIVAMISVIGQSFFLQVERARKDEQLTRALQGVLGRVAQSYLSSLKENPTRLRQTVNRKAEELEGQGKGTAGTVTLDVLQAMSQSVPESAKMEIDVLTYEPAKISFEAESPTQGDAERAISALSQVPLFQSPKAGPLSPGKGESRKFTLNAGIAAGKGN
jgi:cell division ATPase FtsA